jgi:hypothetical protein
MKIKKLGFAAAAFLTIGMTVQVAQATSLNGISANTTMENYKFGSVVKLAVKDDNAYNTSSWITPQKLIRGKWYDAEFFTTSFLKPEQKEYLTFTSGRGKDFSKAGTYRFEIETLHGNNKKDGRFHTTPFVIK